jgi:chromate reductase
MSRELQILGFAGSLRQGSYNRALLKTAAELMPEGARLNTFDLAGIPPFNQNQEQSPPEIVREFKAKIKSADAILIVTPEYNYSVPGVLKNAIDWASRPHEDNAFNATAAMMSASTVCLGAQGAVPPATALRSQNISPQNSGGFRRLRRQKFDSGANNR